VPFLVGGATGALAVADLMDLSAERARLLKEVGGHEAEAGKVHKKLDNADFLARAKPEVVEENRARLAEAEAALEKLRTALARLDALS
jgi:valyl-tRNA synthetase